jgi:hypothetical protein
MILGANVVRTGGWLELGQDFVQIVHIGVSDIEPLNSSVN